MRTLSAIRFKPCLRAYCQRLIARGKLFQPSRDIGVKKPLTPAVVGRQEPIGRPPRYPGRSFSAMRSCTEALKLYAECTWAASASAPVHLLDERRQVVRALPDERRGRRRGGWPPEREILWREARLTGAGNLPTARPLRLRRARPLRSAAPSRRRRRPPAETTSCCASMGREPRNRGARRAETKPGATTTPNGRLGTMQDNSRPHFRSESPRLELPGHRVPS